jgi:hypothetical protein
LVALNWLTPAKIPQVVVGTLDEALHECRVLAEKHRLQVPAHALGQVRAFIEAGRSEYAARPTPLKI